MMPFVSKPPINFFAGWRYLFDPGYRHAIHQEWSTLPNWLVAMQFVAGGCSVLFPLLVAGLLTFVFVSRHL